MDASLWITVCTIVVSVAVFGVTMRATIMRLVEEVSAMAASEEKSHDQIKSEMATMERRITDLLDDIKEYCVWLKSKANGKH